MIGLAEARAWLAAHTRLLPAETVPLHAAAGRVLAADLVLAIRPEAATAVIDGLAVRAADTEGASDYAPLPVRGAPVRPGDRLPPGTDAVLPPFAFEGATATVAIARGHGVAAAGHDVAAGTVLAAGTLLTPQHLAVQPHDLAVIRRPLVAGANGPMLDALLRTAGAAPAVDAVDLILAPPSATTWQTTAIALRPGEQTALGLVGAVPAIRLPPHAPDAATVFGVLIAPTLRRMAGRREPPPIQATLLRKIGSVLGQVDAVRVRLDGTEATPLGAAEGIGLLAAAGADGLVLVPEGSEGYPAGATVPIWPL